MHLQLVDRRLTPTEDQLDMPRAGCNMMLGSTVRILTAIYQVRQ
jgi:hypothetical protein